MTIAPIMIANNGIEANFTLIFKIMNMPQIISVNATAYNRKVGNGSPKLAKKLPSPVSNNFINPETIKTYATTYLMILKENI